VYAYHLGIGVSPLSNTHATHVASVQTRKPIGPNVEGHILPSAKAPVKDRVFSNAR
jgi:hypothetical protein